jgi:CheY-like chemotaxis protein
MPHKLLLADDSVTIQRVIELTFADEDVIVVAVGNGQAAIDSVQRDRPDIVLADVGMPEKNGYEVAAFIKSNPALAHIPVVLLTGAFEPVDEGAARAVGCDGVLVKPFEPQIVISRVKDLLAGRQPSGMWASGPRGPGALSARRRLRRPSTRVRPTPGPAIRSRRTSIISTRRSTRLDSRRRGPDGAARGAGAAAPRADSARPRVHAGRCEGDGERSLRGLGS